MTLDDGLTIVVSRRVTLPTFWLDLQMTKRNLNLHYVTIYYDTDFRAIPSYLGVMI